MQPSLSTNAKHLDTRSTLLDVAASHTSCKTSTDTDAAMAEVRSLLRSAGSPAALVGARPAARTW